MKTDFVIPLAAAFIGAAASFAGVLYSQNASLQVEKLKWEQAYRDETRKNSGTVLSDVAREMSTAVQRVSYLMWQVEMTPESLKAEDFANYDKETKLQMPKLFAAQVLLATNNKPAHDKLYPLISAYWSLDAKISMAGRQFRTNRKAAIETLSGYIKDRNALEQRLIRDFAAAGSMLAPPDAGK